jgi:hypothetical protein
MMTIMTCQICGRAIKAGKGVIAHHGYKRPEGRYYQTASCWGARHLPYEQDCSQLKKNRLGFGIVKGYFVEHGWFGMLVELRDPPDWWKKQMKGKRGKERYAHIFGKDY